MKFFKRGCFGEASLTRINPDNNEQISSVLRNKPNEGKNDKILRPVVDPDSSNTTPRKSR